MWQYAPELKSFQRRKENDSPHSGQAGCFPFTVNAGLSDFSLRLRQHRPKKGRPCFDTPYDSNVVLSLCETKKGKPALVVPQKV